MLMTLVVKTLTIDPSKLCGAALPARRNARSAAFVQFGLGLGFLDLSPCIRGNAISSLRFQRQMEI
jgi:hypothetical protein